jgi:hypothetical protein
MRAQSIASVAVCAGALIAPATVRAQVDAGREPQPARAAVLPALDAPVGDPGDGRDWRYATRIDAAGITVTASAAGGALAVSLQRPHRLRATCRALVGQLFRTDALDPFVTATPAVFRGTPWDAEVFRQRSDTHDGEFGCVRVGDTTWLASAIARPRAGVTLLDAAPVAARLAAALALPTARRGYPVRLPAAALDLGDPGDAAPWLFLGAAAGFPIASDTIASAAGESGGVTLTVGRRPGTCGAAWLALRAGLATEGVLVDRPGYVPADFGPRIRRITIGDRLREVYCLATPAGALLATAVFRGDDGEAMTRLGPMLRAVVAAALVAR